MLAPASPASVPETGSTFRRWNEGRCEIWVMLQDGCVLIASSGDDRARFCVKDKLQIPSLYDFWEKHNKDIDFESKLEELLSVHLWVDSLMCEDEVAELNSDLQKPWMDDFVRAGTNHIADKILAVIKG